MQNRSETQPVPAKNPEPASKPGIAAIGDLLAQAAVIAVEQGLDVDSFMRGAWSAFMEAHPGLREQMEEMHLRSRLDEMRKLGRIGVA